MNPLELDHTHQRRSTLTAALLFGAAFLLFTDAHTFRDAGLSVNPSIPIAKAVETTAVEVPREVIALAEDIARRFQVNQGLALAITSEAFARAHKVGVSPTLVLAVAAVESRYKPSAVNKTSGAVGLMQVLSRSHPEEVKAVGGEQVLTDVGPNLTVGSQILAEYLDIEDGDLHAALARYLGPSTGDTYFSRVKSQMRHLEHVLLEIEHAAH